MLGEWLMLRQDCKSKNKAALGQDPDQDQESEPGQKPVPESELELELEADGLDGSSVRALETGGRRLLQKPERARQYL